MVAVDTLLLSAGAMTELHCLHNWLEPQLGEDGDLGNLADWAGKLLGTVARIAGLLHMAQHGPEGVRSPIDGPTMSGATLIGRYYLAHAQVAFGLIGADPQVEQAQKVLRWIVQSGVDTVTKADMWRGLRRGSLNTADDLDAPLGLLVRHGYLRPRAAERKAKGRTPSQAYDVNPLSLPRNPLNPRNSGGATFTPLNAPHVIEKVDFVDTPTTSHIPAAPISPEIRAYAEAVLNLLDAKSVQPAAPAGEYSDEV